MSKEQPTESDILAASAVEGTPDQQDYSHAMNATTSIYDAKRGSMATDRNACTMQPPLLGPDLKNPTNMRGSLNVGLRRHEMNRINQGNKVSCKFTAN